MIPVPLNLKSSFLALCKSNALILHFFFIAFLKKITKTGGRIAICEWINQVILSEHFFIPGRNSTFSVLHAFISWFRCSFCLHCYACPSRVNSRFEGEQLFGKKTWGKKRATPRLPPPISVQGEAEKERGKLEQDEIGLMGEEEKGIGDDNQIKGKIIEAWKTERRKEDWKRMER